MPATKQLLDRLIDRYQRYAESGRLEIQRLESTPERKAQVAAAQRAEDDRLRKEREGK